MICVSVEVKGTIVSVCVSVIVILHYVCEDNAEAVLPQFPSLSCSQYTHTHAHTVNPSSLILMGHFSFLDQIILFHISLANGCISLLHIIFFLSSRTLLILNMTALLTLLIWHQYSYFPYIFSIRQGSIIKMSSQLLRSDKLWHLWLMQFISTHKEHYSFSIRQEFYLTAS